MKTYLVVKTWPLGPELGTLVTGGQDLKGDGNWVNPAHWPEFWQEVPPRPDEVKDGWELKKAAEAAKAKFMVGYEFRYSPVMQAIRRQIETGALGGLRNMWWNMFRIYKGGMASHGGILGVIVICILFGRRHGVSSLHLLDLFAYSCTVGLFFGRIANFVNGELWGRPLPPEMQSNTEAAADPPWWSVKYPEEVLAWVDTPKEFLLRRELDTIVGGDQGFLPKVVETLQAGEAQAVAVVKPMLTAFYPSQIFQAITDGPILVGVLTLFWLKPRRPGVIGAWFLVVYGVLRILSVPGRL